MEQRIVQDAEKARQATTPGVTRYVLAISTLLVVILFAVAYVIAV